MSYPEPRYLGEGGEATARYRAADESPDLVFPSGTRVHYLARGDATDGLFGLYRWEMAAQPGGATPHFHRTIAESFYVLSGTVRLYDGRRWVDGKPGAFVHVPPGGLHGFRNESGEPASLLIHFAPGAPREPYFEGLVEFATNGQPGPEELAAFYLRHDNIWITEEKTAEPARR